MIIELTVPQYEAIIQAIQKSLESDLTKPIHKAFLRGLTGNLVSQFKTDKETKQDEINDLASRCLCDGELTVSEQIELIRNEKDGSKFIDEVDGVVVWEKAEYWYTCEKFLKLISLK